MLEGIVFANNQDETLVTIEHDLDLKNINRVVDIQSQAAISLANTKTYEASAKLSKTNAGVSASLAGVSATAANNSLTTILASEGSANDSTQQAASYETASLNSMNNAPSYETLAGVSQANALSYENAASGSKTNAASYATAANASATGASGSSYLAGSYATAASTGVVNADTALLYTACTTIQGLLPTLAASGTSDAVLLLCAGAVDTAMNAISMVANKTTTSAANCTLAGTGVVSAASGVGYLVAANMLPPTTAGVVNLVNDIALAIEAVGSNTQATTATVGRVVAAADLVATKSTTFSTGNPIAVLNASSGAVPLCLAMYTLASGMNQIYVANITGASGNRKAMALACKDAATTISAALYATGTIGNNLAVQQTVVGYASGVQAAVNAMAAPFSATSAAYATANSAANTAYTLYMTTGTTSSNGRAYASGVQNVATVFWANVNPAS